MTEGLPPPMTLFRMASGFYVSRAIYVAAKLGIADLLAEGPQSCGELAKVTGTHAPSLRACCAYWLAWQCSPKRGMASSP
jgi:hypothetical protein